MGMPSSAVRFLAWTARKANIERQEQSLSLQKMSLTRAMTRVTREYQNSLSTKTLKWSNNAGVSYSDLSYNTLMRPGAANQNKPYLITNANDQVVLDSKYEKYAKMISPNGASGGDWESNRTKILAELTGISEEKIANSVATNAAVEAAAAKVNALKDEEATDESLKEPINEDKADDFFARAGYVMANGTSYNIGKLYKDVNSWQNLGDASTAKASLTTLLKGIAENMKNYLTETDYKHFESACTEYVTKNDSLFDGKTDSVETPEIKKKDNQYSVNIKCVLDSILGSYKSQSDASSYGQDSRGTEVFYTRDIKSTAWQNWNIKHDDWQKRYDAAMAEYNAAVDTDNMALTSEEESNIKFYDQLFSAIAQKGWTANYQIEDNDYLNNMFQNNQYFITTMDEQVDDKGNKYFEYSTDLASNTNNIFTVNATDVQNEALAKYEHEKAIINEKETRIDTRMTNLETELSAINNMMKGLETVRNDNIERNFGIFA